MWKFKRATDEENDLRHKTRLQEDLESYSLG